MTIVNDDITYIKTVRGEPRLPAVTLQPELASAGLTHANLTTTFARSQAWLRILRESLGHRPYLLTSYDNNQLVGYLPLAFVNSRLFGRFLVSLPYLNSGGVIASDAAVAATLIARAADLANELDVRYLELRHEQPIEHVALTEQMTSKVHLRLQLPESTEALWQQLKAKVRNQVRKAQTQGFTVRWGTTELLDDFYRVLCHNMRDLGTPVFSRELFREILTHLAGQAELCCVYADRTPIAAALLVHNEQVTEVPSASSLRKYNPTNPNMLLYWHLLQRAGERGQRCFDFGRSTVESNTFRFKRQWGAEPHAAAWQYYVRRGTIGDMRPESARYRAMIRTWQRLPVSLTRWLGPAIVRGIP